MLTSIFFLFAFQSPKQGLPPSLSYDRYENLWKEVDTLEAKGLTKSALQKVIMIYDLAKKTSNHPQVVKSLIYTVKYKQVLEEGGFEQTLNEFEVEISVSHFPEKNILQSAASELYWSYYQQNRWKFFGRTQTVNFKANDVSTWDLYKITERVKILFLASLSNADSLQLIPIDLYEAIILRGNMPISFRPTLYDFLSYRAVDFFMNEESTLTQPSYQFYLKGEELFQPAEKFLSLQIETKDSTSGKLLALKILQELLKFHSQDQSPVAFIEADLRRFEFLRGNSVEESKDSLYLNGLLDIEKKFSGDSASAIISFAIASFYFERSDEFQPPYKTDYRWDKKTALDYCDKVIQKFPDTKTASNCAALRSRIVFKNISLTVEEVNIPDRPFRGLIEYRNAKDIYFRIIKNSDSLEEKIKKLDTEKQYAALAKEPVVQQWSQSLPDPGDYQQHASEIKIPALSLGQYLILGSDQESFSTSQSLMFKEKTTISNISYVSKRNKNTYSFYLLDRESGKPMAGVEAMILSQQYDNGKRSNFFKEIGKYYSDHDGYFEMNTSVSNQNFTVKFSKGADQLMANNYFYLFPGEEKQEKSMRTVFFTDRSIYRPGQTIYFKGITIQSDGSTNELVTKFNTSVELHDVNGQKIESLKLTTNDYGSMNGTFTAPSNGLNGEMAIRNESGSIIFSVEEYKRPHFEVIFNSLKGSFRLNDEVSVNGAAKSFAGGNIDGAVVKYRIVRQAKFPIWFFGMKRGGYDERSDEMEIGNGITSTDSNGRFQIAFVAIPDSKIPKKENPQFNYRLIADVVDLTGETHSSETVITIGYVSLKADINIPESISKDSLERFEIATENLDGIFEPAEGTIVIYSLQQPDRIFRQRLWKRPDQFVMTKDEYHRLFPNDVFDNEDDYTSWEKKAKVVDQRFNTSASKIISIESLHDSPQGKFLLELIAKDKYGEAVKIQKYFTLYDPKKREIPLIQPVWNSGLPEKAESGTTLMFQSGSSEEQIHLIYEIQAKDFSERKSVDWKKGKQNLSIPVTENFKGGLSITTIAVKHGRIYIANKTVSVPYADKHLNLKFETFRNKLLPGQNEEWMVNISGLNGEDVAAEMVAGMYDASLDAFRLHNWDFDIENRFYPFSNWEPGDCFGVISSDFFVLPQINYPPTFSPVFDQLNWFGFSFGMHLYARGEMTQYETVSANTIQNDSKQISFKKETALLALNADSVAIHSQLKSADNNFDHVSTRKNLQETAFFYPELQTDSNGNVIIRFTIPEALTRWKFLGFAHTKDLKYGMIANETITQKELMVTPNAPRFFRESDKIFFAAKVTNLSDHIISGNCILQLSEASNMKSVDRLFANIDNIKSYTIAKGQSSSLYWELAIPEGIDAVDYKILATAGNQSDGEENVLPVLPNKTLVTETLPLNIRGNSTREYRFDKLLQSHSSTTLKNYNLSLEFTNNPAWYAVQAFPYLMEYPYDCSEQIFNRFYANALASNVANSNPKIRLVFDQWRNLSSDALLSNLEKNQELKSLLLEETPWVMKATDETERKKRIALLFDLNRMSNEMDVALNQLQKLQTENGGWSWFSGGPDDRYITQYILAGIGHLNHLNVSSIKGKTNDITLRAITYIDQAMREDYDKLIRNKTKMADNQLSHYTAQYLYARSFFQDIPVSEQNKKAFDYYLSQAAKYWTSQNLYSQGMISLVLQRYGDRKAAAAIVLSLKENSITSEERGMYWKSNNTGYYWYQAPVETQALLIEAFDEISGDQRSIDNMKMWLLKQKQTNEWSTTKATAEAVYALLLHGGNWIMDEPDVKISLGSSLIDLLKVSKEAGTGYFKTSWSGNEIKPEMGNIKVTRMNNDNGISWGAVYWQYFEQLDKITPSEIPLSLQKKLFIQRNSDHGPVMEPVTSTSILKPGDLIKVRIELRADRDMEYVHMKDSRAACFEPLNVISGYRWQDGLGYYEETKDAATNFFFDHLTKGTYVFEYPLRVQLMGDFSNGIATIECMYAPEFTSHSGGTRIVISK